MNNRKIISLHGDAAPWQRAVKRGPYPMPETAFNASKNTSRNADDVTFICSECGVVPPIVVYIGQTEELGYLRRECTCMERERARREQAAVLEENRAASWARTASRTYTWLGIDQAALALLSFEQFNPDAQPEEYRRSIIDAHSYAQGYASMCAAGVMGQPNLLFLGGYGTGKTHLACAICNRLHEARIRCLFTTAQDLFDSLYAAPFEEKPHILQQASDTPLLVLDDLDKLHVKQQDAEGGSFQKRTLFDILDRRYKGRRPTIITTNVSDLSPWLDGATLSRFYENFQPIPMNGADYRLLRRQLGGGR